MTGEAVLAANPGASARIEYFNSPRGRALVDFPLNFAPGDA